MTIKSCCCGSGGGGLDRLAPTIVVGNVPAGDSATSYSSGGFIYIPDVGDGAGIEAALTAIDAAGEGGTVYVRRGTYDFNLAGSPTAPLAVGPGVTLAGEGSGTLLIPRSSGDQTLINVYGGNSTLRDFEIAMPALVPGAVYAGVTQGLIEVSSAGAGPVRISDLNIDMNLDTIASGVVLRAAINLVNDSIETHILRVKASSATYHLDGETDWIRFVGIEQITARYVYITDCYAETFDAGITIGLTGLCEVKGLICTGFGRRYLHQLASDTLARVTIIGGHGTSNDPDAIGLSLHSHQDASAKVANLSLLSFNATNPAVRIRSAANAGHAQFVNCAFTWPHVAGAVLEIGTSGSGNPCDRNTINGCHFHNSDGTAGACAVQVFNATSVNNIILGNSCEVTGAGVAIIDGGTTTQSAYNI